MDVNRNRYDLHLFLFLIKKISEKGDILKKIKQMILISVVSVLALVGCTSEGIDEGSLGEEEKLQVMTTFYPMYEFTKKIVGDSADVRLLVPAGTDSHTYEPSAKDVGLLNQSDIFIYNSVEMETWVPTVLDSLVENDDLTIVEAANSISLLENSEEGYDDHEDHGHVHEKDPHVWLDPVLAQEEVHTIKEALIEVDPKHAAGYEENALAFIEELKELDDEFTSAFTGASQRVFVTEHEAFGYLAARYDLTQVSVAGLSTENEPSPAQLMDVYKLIQEKNITTIYTNTNSTQTIADTLANEADITITALHSLEGVTNEEKEAGEDYLSLMRKNLHALKESIQ